MGEGGRKGVSESGSEGDCYRRCWIVRVHNLRRRGVGEWGGGGEGGSEGGVFGEMSEYIMHWIEKLYCEGIEKVCCKVALRGYIAKAYCRYALQRRLERVS